MLLGDSSVPGRREEVIGNLTNAKGLMLVIGGQHGFQGDLLGGAVNETGTLCFCVLIGPERIGHLS